MQSLRTLAEPLSRGSNAGSLEQLSDGELLASTRRLVGRSNQLLAELLAHLGEVEARGIHRTRACASLYAYCLYELRLSEDEAYRRVAAARLVRRFPALLDALASGELHLTGLLLLGPHLTPQNLTEVLARAKHRSKREILRLVRILDPLPAVPARIEPLGPAPAPLVPRTPTWEEFVHATCPVRDLAPGERPRDWMEAPVESDVPPAPARVNEMRARPRQSEAHDARPLASERFKVQFTATEEYVRLVEQAKALLSHATPNLPFEELQLRAMRALVAELTKKKFGSARNPPGKTEEKRPSHSTEPQKASRQKSRNAQRDEPAPAPARNCREPRHPQPDGDTNSRSFDKPTRHIPAAVRRAVFERDGFRCTYVASTGERCPETHRLEFHHLEPFAWGGTETVSNLTLRCKAHNALAAEQDFGREFMENMLERKRR